MSDNDWRTNQGHLNLLISEYEINTAMPLWWELKGTTDDIDYPMYPHIDGY